MILNKKYTTSVACTAFMLFSITGFSQVRSYMKADTLRDSRGNVAGVSTLEFQVTEGVSYQDRLENLQAQKVSYFSNYIGFTAKEAQLFWPLYNEYIEKLNDIRVKQDKIFYLLSSSQLMTLDEKAVKKNLDEYVQCGSAANALNLEYYRKFSEVLSPVKMARLYVADKQFQQMLIRALRGR